MKQSDKIFEFAKRTAHLKPEGAYHVLGRALQLEKEGREIIHFEIGQPDFPTFENILEEAGVALLPGSAFGAYGESYLRLSYATGVEAIREGLARIRRVLS